MKATIFSFPFKDFDTQNIIIPKEKNDLSESEYEILLGLKNLKSIEVESENKSFFAIDNCLIDRESHGILKAAKNSNIPVDKRIDSIGKFAFSGLRLKSLRIPENIKFIGDFAFKNCVLQNIYIPKSVKEIRRGAFCGINYYKNLTVDKDNPYFYSENDCLIRKKDKTLFAIPQRAVIPYGVKIINELTFMAEDTNRHVITIPKTVEKIEKSPLKMPHLIEFPITVKAPRNSYAIKFVKKNCIEYIELV